MLLRATTRVSRNKMLASQLLAHFEGVPHSANYTLDFRDCNVTRGMKHYQRALGWSRIFLNRSSFTVFAGSEAAVAILFPMEKIFESYVAAKLRVLAPKHVSVKTQDRTHTLFTLPHPTFSLRPDVVLESTHQTVVIDTKWKMLAKGSRIYGISQGDMYQMYAYAKSMMQGRCYCSTRRRMRSLREYHRSSLRTASRLRWSLWICGIQLKAFAEFVLTTCQRRQTVAELP